MVLQLVAVDASTSGEDMKEVATGEYASEAGAPIRLLQGVKGEAMHTPETFTFHQARVFSGSMDDLVQCLRHRLDEPADRPTTFIATPNPEMYVNSAFDDDFRAIL